MTRRTRQTDPRIAVAYLRVSTDEQKNGPEAQRAAITAWASRSGVAVVAWHLDQGVSGASGVEERPALLAALDDVARQRAGTLVVAKRDRVARDIYVSQMIVREVERRGARIVCADGIGNGDAPADALMRTVLDGVAAFERDMIRARTKAALAVKRSRGETTGVAPWGTRVSADGRTLEPEPREALIAERARSLRAKGVPLRRIVDQLAIEGHTGRSGAPLGLKQVARMTVQGREPHRDAPRDRVGSSGYPAGNGSASKTT